MTGWEEGLVPAVFSTDDDRRCLLMLHFNDGAGTSPSSQPVIVSSQNSPSFGLSYNSFTEQTVGVPVFTQPRQWTESDSPALVEVTALIDVVNLNRREPTS